jgi:integrase
MLDKPTSSPAEAKWLTVAEGALLLERARTYVPKRADIAFPPGFLHALVATCLLTGGRETEVLGLEVNDIDFANSTVTFRTNQWRRLKTKKSARTIPLWPQLREVLKPYIGKRKGGLLFPSPFLDKPGMITDWRKALDAIATRTEVWKPGEVRSKALRHTYASARLQTTDGDKPIAVFTASRELGHSDTSMLERILRPRRQPAAPIERGRVQDPAAQGEAGAAAQALEERIACCNQVHLGGVEPTALGSPQSAALDWTYNIRGWAYARAL